MRKGISLRMCNWQNLWLDGFDKKWLLHGDASFLHTLGMFACTLTVMLGC